MEETVRLTPLKGEIGTPEIVEPQVQEMKERIGELKAVTASTELFSLYSSASSLTCGSLGTQGTVRSPSTSR